MSKCISQEALEYVNEKVQQHPELKKGKLGEVVAMIQKLPLCEMETVATAMLLKKV